MKKLYVVRVVIPNIDVNVPPLAQPLPGGLLDSLRYMGVVNLHYDDERGQLFDIFPPKCVAVSESKTWSEMNAKRMGSFGYNAASAPSTEDPTERE